MSRESYDERIARFQESQREKSPLEQSAGARWEQFRLLREHGNEVATQQYLDSVLKSEYGLLSENENIALDNVTEDTFFDAALQHEMQQKEKERLKQEGEELLQEYCNDNNRDVTSSCAICDQSVVQCLCSFEMSPIERDDILYSWKAKPSAPILSSFLVLANQDQKASLSYTIVGTCIHGKTDCCTLTYAQMNPKKGSEEKKGAKEGILELEFEMDAIVGEESEVSPYYISYNEAKGIHPLRDEKSPLILGPDQLPDFTVGGFVTSFKRAFSLASTSKIDCMPATVYDVLIKECAEDQYIPRNYVRTYLLPQYEAEFGIVFNFQGKKAASFSHLGLSIEGFLKEKIFSEKTIEYKSKVDVSAIASASRSQYTAGKDHLEKSGGMIATVLKMLDGLDKLKIPMKSFSALPVTISFEFPIIEINGGCSIEYAESEGETESENIQTPQNKLYVKREEIKIAAKPLIGGKLELNILEMLATVLSPGAAKVVRKAMNMEGKYGHFKAHAKLSSTLEGGGYITIPSSPANESPAYQIENLRGNMGVALEAVIEAGFQAFYFNASFTAGMKLVAKLELGIYRNSKNGELGWYFGTNGIALYWTLIFSFGIGGERGKDDSNEAERESGYGSSSIDVSGVADKKELSWEESLTKQTDEELRQNLKYLQDLEREKYVGGTVGFDYRQGDRDASRGDVIQRRRELELQIKGRAELAKHTAELAQLTAKYQRQGDLSSKDNSRRLALIREIEKINKDYGVSNDGKWFLDEQQEYDLLMQRKEELDDIILANAASGDINRKTEDLLMGRVKGDGAETLARQRRKEAEAELKSIIGEEGQETSGKAILLDATIFAYDNLVSEDLKTLKKEMVERLDE